MRHCQIYDMQVLGRITIKQYSLMMEAVKMRQVYEREQMHLQAWLNARANDKLMAGAGKNKKEVPRFKTFNEFYQLNEKTTRGEKDSSEMQEFKSLLANANRG